MTLSDEEKLNNAIPKIDVLIRKNWKAKRYLDLRLLIITPSQYLRVYKGDMNHHMEMIESAAIEQIGKRQSMRGDTLAFFSRVEGLVKEIIQARILGLFTFSDKAAEFDDILQKAGFRGCVEVLESWGVIEGNLKRRIEKISTVRNQYAHSWSDRDVYYEKDPSKKNIRLANNIVKFREDAKSVWLGLIKIYMHYELKDIGRLYSNLTYELGV